MKVVWFTNVPGLAWKALGLNRHQGGWIEGLESVLRQEAGIDLVLAFGGETLETQLIQNHETCSYVIPRDLPGWEATKGWRKRVNVRTSVIQEALRIIEHEQPDIVHVFGTEGPFGLLTSYAPCPVIISIQGNLTAYSGMYFGKSCRFEFILRDPFRSLIGRSSLLTRYSTYLEASEREQEILAAARHVSGRTDWDRNLSRVFAPSAAYHHCDEILRSEFYDCDSWVGPRPGPARFVSTIRGNAYKGLDLICEVMKILRALPETKDSEWQVIGIRQDETVVRSLSSQQRTMIKSGAVRLLGRMGPSEMISVLRNSSAYVHPSYIDNSPNALCEAMILGLPVVATSSGGVPSLVTDGISGLLTQPGEPYGMAGGLLSILGSPDLARCLGEEAEQQAQTRHNRARVAEAIRSIYKVVSTS